MPETIRSIRWIPSSVSAAMRETLELGGELGLGTLAVGLATFAQPLDLGQVRADEGERVVHLVRDSGQGSHRLHALCLARDPLEATLLGPVAEQHVLAPVSPRSSRTWSAVTWMQRAPVVSSSLESAEPCSASRPSSSRSARGAGCERGRLHHRQQRTPRSDAAGAPRIASAAGSDPGWMPTLGEAPRRRAGARSRRGVSGSAWKPLAEDHPVSSISEIAIPEAVRS
jgi:hypothetical protein